MGAERIRTLMRQIKEALDRGWAGWTKQAAELHTFFADQENRLKEGKGFTKSMKRVSLQSART